MVGSFGDAAIFDFAKPGTITCGEGGIVVTDNIDLAMAIRRRRPRRPEDRHSLSLTTDTLFQAGMGDIIPALALSQLRHIDCQSAPDNDP